MQGKSYHALTIPKNEAEAKAEAVGISLQHRNITWNETWTSLSLIKDVPLSP